MEVRDYGLYIAGKSVPASSTEPAAVLDPATNRPFARVASGSRDDVNAAVEAARAAFDSADWRDLDPSKRGRLLWVLGQQVRDHFDELSRLEAQNVGKPLREAEGDIAYVYKVFEYYAGVAEKIQGEAIPRPRGRLGSTDTGKQLLRVVADRVVPTTLELGGKNPQIVLADAKIDRAVKGALWGAFQNAGQMCWAGSKLLVHESIASSFLGKLQDQVEKLRLGPPLKDDVQMGPLVSREHATNVVAAIEDGIGKGAKLLAGGGRTDAGELKDGNFVKPTVFEDPPAAARVAREEVFGPVVAAWHFDDLDDAIARANDTVYGLAAGVWTQDVGKAHAIARRLQAGMVSINEFPVTFPQTPFLGWKQSGLGQEQGVDAVLFYTHVKNVLVNLE